MQSMKCFQCALKHTATALSFGKEILSGHGEGADLDHRIDFLGELTNLEQHLKLLDENLSIQVKNYRQMMQAKKIAVSEQDLQYLRQLYVKIEKSQKGQQNLPKKESEINTVPCVLFLHIKDKNYFNLCYSKLQQNLSDYSKIYYLKSDIDLSNYDIEKIEYKDIEQEYIYIISEKDIILKPMSAKALLRIQDYKNNLNIKQLVEELKLNQPYFYYDNFPCIVSKSNFWEYLDKDIPLTFYCNKYKSEFEYKTFQVAIKLDKILCCSNKSKMKTAIYCYIENEVALNSVIDYFKLTNS